MENSSLARVESYVERVANALRRLEEEKAQLRQRIDVLLEELEELKEGNLAKGCEIEVLREERLEIKARLMRIREGISSLESPGRENKSKAD